MQFFLGLHWFHSCILTMGVTLFVSFVVRPSYSLLTYSGLAFVTGVMLFAGFVVGLSYSLLTYFLRCLSGHGVIRMSFDLLEHNTAFPFCMILINSVC